MSAGFTLHERLAADTAPIADLDLCAALLMNDARFPWIILVPRRAGLREIEGLSEADQHQLLREIHRASAAVRALCAVGRPCVKLNVAALGNMVPQLHIHVIARRADDPAWPGPVWGVGETEPYGGALAAAVETARAELLAATQ